MNYYAAYNCFPSPDFDGHSWRMRVLPFMQSSPVYSEYRFDESWDSEINLSLDIRPLQSKGDTMRVFPNVYGPPCGTNAIHASAYLMINGEHAFGLSGQFQRKASIADGLDRTIAVAETMATDTHWLSPNDFDLSKMSMRVNSGPSSISSLHSSGPAVLFCDGEVFRLNPSIDEDTLRALLTVDGGESISRDKLISTGLLLPP